MSVDTLILILYKCNKIEYYKYISIINELSINYNFFQINMTYNVTYVIFHIRKTTRVQFN